jgi:hypothetical protein
MEIPMKTLLASLGALALLAVGLILALPQSAGAGDRDRTRDRDRDKIHLCALCVQSPDCPNCRQCPDCPCHCQDECVRAGQCAGKGDCAAIPMADRIRDRKKDGTCDGSKQQDRQGSGGKQRGRK